MERELSSSRRQPALLCLSPIDGRPAKPPDRPYNAAWSLSTLEPAVNLMDISSWLQGAKERSFATLAKTSQAVGAGLGYVRQAVGSTWLFGSTESSQSYDGKPVDEKHYFLIPDRRSTNRYSLYSWRPFSAHCNSFANSFR